MFIYTLFEDVDEGNAEACCSHFSREKRKRFTRTLVGAINGGVSNRTCEATRLTFRIGRSISPSKFLSFLPIRTETFLPDLFPPLPR